MSTSRRSLAETYEAQDLIIQAAQDVKREATKAYREYLDGRGMDKDAVKAEVEGFKKAFRRKMDGKKKGTEAVEHIDAIADEIYLEITAHRAPRATRVENIEEFRSGGASDARLPPKQEVAGSSPAQTATEPPLSEAAGQAGAIVDTGAFPSSVENEAAEISTPHPEAKTSTDGGTTEQDIEMPADSVTGEVSRPDAGRSASATSEIMDATAGETATNITTFKAKPLRPHCLRPEKCGGQGKEHCWSCKQAMNEAGVA